jgi:flagellar hook assembly protein FlgD
VRTIEGAANAGMNRATWDMTGGRGRTVEPGEYTVTLEVGGKKLTQKARVLPPQL